MPPLVSDRAGLPCDVSLAGIPVSESRDSLEKCFNFYSIDPECDDFELYGLNSTGIRIILSHIFVAAAEAPY